MERGASLQTQERGERNAAAQIDASERDSSKLLDVRANELTAATEAAVTHAVLSAYVVDSRWSPVPPLPLQPCVT